MSKSSIHIAPGNLGYFSHNSRQSFSQSQVFFDEDNEISSTKEEAFKIYRQELAIRSDAYTKRTKQTIQKKTVTHLSAIVNLEQHHTLEDLKPLVKYLETELDTKVTQVAIHRDEGKLVNKETEKTLTSGEHFFCDPSTQTLYFDQEYTDAIDMSQWNMEKNYHAHIEFMGLASDGKSIKRELSTWFFRKLQDFTADTLNMERGEKTEPSYTKEQMKAIKAELKPKKTYTNDKAYGAAFISVAKELGYWKPKPKRKKRKDTHDYKAERAKENELTAKALAKQKDLKEQITRLRIELQTQKAARSDYAALEQLNKDLKEKIKQKDLLLEDLKTETKKFKAENQTLTKLAYTTEEYWVGEEDQLTETVEVSYKELYQRATSDSTKERYSFLENKVDTQESQIIRLEERLRLKEFETTWHNTELEEQMKENTTLKSQNEQLEAKIATLPSPDVIEELKTLKNDFEELNHNYWELNDLAYDENRIETVLDEHGVAHDKTFKYKEGYEKAIEEITEQDELIGSLNDGYSKIETKLFGKDENRSVDEIVEAVNTLATALINVAEYLNLGIQKFIQLFKKSVPDKKEIEKEQTPKIESALPKEKAKQPNTPKRIKP